MTRLPLPQPCYVTRAVPVTRGRGREYEPLRPCRATLARFSRRRILPATAAAIWSCRRRACSILGVSELHPIAYRECRPWTDSSLECDVKPRTPGTTMNDQLTKRRR